MYQVDFICTYKWMDNEADQEQLYRIQLLQAFDLNEWDDAVVNASIQRVYALVAETPEFKSIFSQARENANIKEMLELFQLSGEKDLDQNDIIFKLLFKFEYFDALHRCLVDFLLTNTLSLRYATNLLNLL